MTDEEKEAIETINEYLEIDEFKFELYYFDLKKANKTILKLIQKQESIIKNACYIIKKTNKQFKDFDDIKLNEYLYNFDKCATIKEAKNE